MHPYGNQKSADYRGSRNLDEECGPLQRTTMKMKGSMPESRIVKMLCQLVLRALWNTTAANDRHST